jgi:Tol biopolymer transport system component
MSLVDARRSTPYAARRALLVATAAVALLVMGQPVPASATYPGGAGRIAFQGVDGVTGRLQLFTVSADGTDQRQLTSFPQADIESPDWSPDGSTISFDSDLAGNVHVFTIRANGAGLTQVTSGDGSEFAPAWSPDGRRLALERAPVGQPDGIFLMGLRSKISKRLTANPFGQFDSRPQFSPDGTRLAFARLKAFLPHGGALSAVYVMDADGTHLRRLTGWGMNAAEPDWSPDGSTIVFNSADDQIQRAGVFVIRPDGTGLRRLTHGHDVGSFRPCWSPTGTQIVFTRVMFGPDGAGAFRFYTMRPDGTHAAPIPHPAGFENQADWGAARSRQPEVVGKAGRSGVLAGAAAGRGGAGRASHAN